MDARGRTGDGPLERVADGLAMTLLIVAAIGAAALPVQAERPELAVEADFENANAEVVSIDQEARVVTITPRQVREARNIWWHLRITGIEPGETIELRIEDFDPVASESHPVYSYDGVEWHRMDDARTPHRQTFTESSVRISRNIPYTYSDSLALAERLGGHPHVQVEDLCISEEGRPVKLLRVSDPDGPDEAKKLIWVQARQHAFESHSSRVAEGFAEWITGDSEAAAELRRRAIVYLVPMMDVDSVATGAAGKDQEPVDFNRDWSEQPHWNAVAAAIDRIDRETRERELLMLIDLHNPYYRGRPHWHLSALPARLQKNFRAFGGRFAEAVRQMPGENTWENWFVTSYISGPSTARAFSARRWLAETSRGFSVTMESPHWRDNDGAYITAQGLLDYGAALGLAMVEHMRHYTSAYPLEMEAIDPAGLRASASSEVQPAVRAVDGAGLSSTEADTTAHATDERQMWLAERDDADDAAGLAWLKIDLGGLHRLEAMRLWNYNAAESDSDDADDADDARTAPGVQTASLYVSADERDPDAGTAFDPANWTPLLKDELIGVEAPGSGDYDDPVLTDLRGAEARHLLILVETNYGDPDHVGIGAIRLHGEPIDR